MIITQEIAEQLIARDKNWSRFQRFAVDLISKVEGVQYVTSALSHDEGRDARPPLVSTEKLKYVLCTSTKDTPKGAIRKAKDDLGRLKEAGLPRRVTFCFNCELQERHKKKIWEQSREIAPHCAVRAEGVEYLAPAAVNHDEIFKRYYAGELLALRHGLLTKSSDLPGRSIGLRIAMATQFGEDAVSLRLSAMTNLVRLTLVSKTAGIERDILLSQVSSELGLSKSVNVAYLDSAVDDLVTKGELSVRGEFVALTLAGKELAHETIRDARNRLLDGRETFLQELRRGLPQPFNDDLFDYLWPRLQDGIADFLLNEGMSMVRVILDPMIEDDGRENAVLVKLVNQVIPPGLLADEQILLSHTILQVLTGRTKTREWLCQVAATFVSICALGLHPQAQEQLLDRLRKWTLMVDNHVAISFLCNGESDHDGVKRVIESWRSLKREVVTCTAVLEEAAYSAFHSEQEYSDKWRMFAALSDEAATEFIENPFVRAFHRSSRSGYQPARWSTFIQNYRGLNEFDGEKLATELGQSGWRVIDDTKLAWETVRELKNFLSPSSKRCLWRRRAEWDARTAMAAMHWHRKKFESEGSVVIVTKSDAIRTAIDWIHGQSMGRLSIMSVSALAYAMALTPRLSLNLTDIRDLLFDPNLVNKAFGRLEPQARRIAIRDREEGLELAGTAQLRGRLHDALASEFGRIDTAVKSGNENSKRKSRNRKLR